MFRRIARPALLAVSAFAVVVTSMVGPVGAVDGPIASANARYLAASYQTLLDRPADTGGLDFHLSRIAAGGDRTRAQAARTMLFSVEGSRNEVRRAYTDILERTPDAGGEAYWTDHLQRHSVLDLRVLLLASLEYRLAAGGTADGWLDALYQDLLGRAPDAGGRAYWKGEIEAGVAPALIVVAIYVGEESLGRRADAHFDEILDRAPSPAERSAAATEIVTLGERHLRARLWASDEVFEGFLDEALA